MFLSGTLLNVATVLAGTVVGVAIGARMPGRMQESLTTGLGFFTVLIGVNDVVQAVADADYERNVARILGELAEHVPPHRIVAVAVPDYTVTPRGADFGDPVQQSDAILRCNAILREACEQRAIRFVPEIFEISRAAPGRPEMLAPDGLHPSGLQYARWVDAIEPAVRGVLGSPGRTVAERA